MLVRISCLQRVSWLQRHLDLLIKYRKNLKSNKGMTEILPFQVKLYQRNILYNFISNWSFSQNKIRISDVTRKEKSIFITNKTSWIKWFSHIFLYSRSYTLKYLFFSLNIFFRMNTSKAESFKIVHRLKKKVKSGCYFYFTAFLLTCETLIFP